MMASLRGKTFNYLKGQSYDSWININPDGLKYSTTVSSKASKSTTTIVRNVELDAANVPGLSSAVVSIPNGEVGPGAAKQGQYKNPEYFCYNPISYFEAEIEIAKYRIAQPSSKQK